MTSRIIDSARLVMASGSSLRWHGIGRSARREQVGRIA
jgi:hypothetical protein